MWLVDLDEPQKKLLPKDHFGGEAKSMREAVTYFAESRGELVDSSDKLFAIASALAPMDMYSIHSQFIGA